MTQAVTFLGWTPEKLSGHIQKHYMGIDHPVPSAPIGDWAQLNEDQRAGLTGEVVRRARCTATLEAVEGRYAGVGLGVARKYSRTKRSQTIRSALDAAAARDIDALDYVIDVVSMDEMPAVMSDDIAYPLAD